MVATLWETTKSQWIDWQEYLIKVNLFFCLGHQTASLRVTELTLSCRVYFHSVLVYVPPIYSPFIHHKITLCFFNGIFGWRFLAVSAVVNGTRKVRLSRDSQIDLVKWQRPWGNLHCPHYISCVQATEGLRLKQLCKASVYTRVGGWECIGQQPWKVELVQ